MRSTRVLLGGFAAAAVATVLAGIGPADAVDKDSKNATPSRDALVELGRRLFMDPAASRLGTNSCASCHDPERGFSDPRPVSVDDSGPTRRHSQTLIDLSGEGFHWDGEFDTVRELLVARVAPPNEALAVARTRVASRVEAAQREHGPGTLEITPPNFYYGETRGGPVTPSADRLSEDGRYAEAFTATFGTTKPTTAQIIDAMDAYCASIRSATNAFDRFRAGDASALSDSAKRGFALFEGRAGCATCHVSASEGGRAAFTDGKFHDTGVSTRGEAAAPGKDGKKPKPDLGLAETTFLGRNGRKFKTPTLRDVASHAPYMHDAAFATLTDVVRYYAGGGTPHDGLDPSVKPFEMTDGDVADMVAFLESLSGTMRAGLGFSSLDVKPLRVRVVGVDGKPLPGLVLDVAPFGDRLLGETPERAATGATTGEDGIATIVRPLATHVVLTSATHNLEFSRPIPDTCTSRTLVAVARGTIAVRVRRQPSYPGFPAEIAVRTPWNRCDDPSSFTLRRAGSLGIDEALYTAPGLPGGVDVECTIRIAGQERKVSMPMGGGVMKTIWLE